MADGTITQDSATERVVNVRPTLFIALGGTGMEIMMRIRRKLLLADWNGNRISSLADFPAAEFLYLDTDVAKASESKHFSMKGDPILHAIELGSAECIQEKSDVARYQNARETYPEISAWLHGDDLSTVVTENGAGQVRAISRALFFTNAERIRNLVQQKLRSLTSNVQAAGMDRMRKLGLEVEVRNPRVVVLASTAGGTGSGASWTPATCCGRSPIRNPTPSSCS